MKIDTSLEYTQRFLSKDCLSETVPPSHRGGGNVDWEAIVRQTLPLYFGEKTERLSQNSHQIIQAIERGNIPEEETVEELRDSLIDMQRIVEEAVVPQVDGLEPYERADEALPPEARNTCSETN